MDSWELGVDDLQWTDQDLRTWLGDQSYLFDEALKTGLDFLEVYAAGDPSRPAA